MAKAKIRKKTSNSDRGKRNVKIEIIGIIIISIGLLSLISMYSKSTGFFGAAIRKTLITLFGLGSYFFPIIIVLIGLLFILNKKAYFKRFLTVIISYISLLTIIDINFLTFVDGLSFLDRVKLSIDASDSAILSGKLATGGGVIGSSLSYVFLSLFGSIGSYIVIVTIIIISFLVFANISILKLAKVTIGKILITSKQKSDRVKESTRIENKEKETVDHLKYADNITIDNLVVKSEEAVNTTSSSDNDSKIRVLDYTKNNTDSKLLIEKKEDSLIDKEEQSIEISNTSEEVNYDNYQIPSIELLKDIKTNNKGTEKKEVLLNANKLIDTLSNFGIEAKVLQVSIGPSITRYEIQPAPGVKVSRIVSLTNDIALSLASSDIRMEAPIPGKSAIGIEVPNKHKAGVSLKEILQSKEYNNVDTLIPMALGKDIAGKPIVANIGKMPHLLIAGATGSGKSVCINTLIASILFKAKPDEVKLLLIDPKVVELSIYNGIPHLLIPVVTDPKKAAFSLNWAVQEMTKRYNLFAKNNVRDLESYNNKAINNSEMEKLPQLVIIIDELADLMMVSASEVEDYICRLAQMARAAGIHLIVATQRPSVDIITGTIKANIPSRISFAVSSQADSRTILDMGGAEKLLGKGDMLFYPVGESKPVRIQGAYISEEEINELVEYLKSQYSPNYEEKIVGEINNNFKVATDESDKLLPEAIEIVVDEGQASISLLQRRLKIGYARAARIIDEMEIRGVVGGYEGSKPRKVLVTKEELEMD
ncbi:DNA translocase FtsK [Proteiniborus ethanoligenes]|uniref:DNA translocase FtsK n=1 Tax=Proteiniborus ethanoligenes TaxID=415015 RepID=A0A1H3N7S1_9FIRM|nr:DNA translocase FtsK [Proteiniborus ethanoligenes]SDY84922.1 DNA translocase FtsK [Proteiniborus ethanoligenes]